VFEQTAAARAAKKKKKIRNHFPRAAKIFPFYITQTLKAYEVTRRKRADAFMAYFFSSNAPKLFLLFFPRPSKPAGGAWMNELPSNKALGNGKVFLPAPQT